MNIQCLPSSLATTRSTELFTPNGLPQRMQRHGSSCLSMRAMAVAARKSICGVRLITFSGQVALHSPHCTQASSAKRSIGRSGSSDSAPVGHADTQERQSVQPSTLTSTVPNGAPCRQRHDIDRRGRGCMQFAQREPHHVALARRPAEKVAGLRVPSTGAIARSVSPSASGSSVSIVATRVAAKPRPARIGSASAIVL